MQGKNACSVQNVLIKVWKKFFNLGCVCRHVCSFVLFLLFPIRALMNGCIAMKIKRFHEMQRRVSCKMDSTSVLSGAKKRNYLSAILRNIVYLTCLVWVLLCGSSLFAQGAVTSICFTACTRQTNGISLTLSFPTNQLNRLLTMMVFCKDTFDSSKWFNVGYSTKMPGTNQTSLLVSYTLLPVWTIEMPNGDASFPRCITNVVMSFDRYENFTSTPYFQELSQIPSMLQTNYLYFCNGRRKVKERYYFTATRAADADGDGIDDGIEILQVGSDPENVDTDGDGFDDMWECCNGLDPTVGTGINGPDGDLDSDGVSNWDEYLKGGTAYMKDSDQDGMPDGWEVLNNFSISLRDSSGDADGDGLSNLEEYQQRTNPRLSDTDNDGLKDNTEVLLGLDPGKSCAFAANVALHFLIRSPIKR